MIKISVNLGINKCENNHKSALKLNRLQNLLLISIDESLKKDVSNVDLENRQDKSTYIFNKVIIKTIFLFDT